MKRYGLVGEYDLFIDEVDGGEYYGADEVDDTITKIQAEVDELKEKLKLADVDIQQYRLDRINWKRRWKAEIYRKSRLIKELSNYIVDSDILLSDETWNEIEKNNEDLK